MLKKMVRLRIGLRTVKTAAAVIISMLLVDRLGTSASKLIFAMLGAMAAYVSGGGMGDFLPMNANFGLVERLGHKVRGGKAKRNEALSERALEALSLVLAECKE